MKKFALYLLFICFLIPLLASQTISASAATKNLIELQECAELWLEQNYNDDTYIDNIIPIYDENEIIGVSVDYAKNSEPNGYFIYDFTQEIVSEFAFDGSSPYQALESKSKELLDIANNSENKLFKLSAFNYGIIKQQGSIKKLIDIYGKVTVLPESSKFYKNNTVNSPFPYNSFINASSLPSGTYSSKYLNNIDNFTPLLMNNLASSPGIGNCGPTAATNMVWYWRFRGKTAINSNSQTVYNAIVAEIGQEVNITMAQAANGAKAYVKSVGYTTQQYNYLFDSWAYYKRDIADDYTILTSIQTSGGGHLVLTVGYREYSNAKYLRMIDGWYVNNNRYVNYNDSNFNSIMGYRWRIK